MSDLYHRKYGDTEISGSAQVVQGDLNIHLQQHVYGSPLRQDKYEILFDSLGFNRMDARLRDIELPLPQTCEWLHAHEHFLAWKDHSKVQDHHGLLWLKGKPGSGKSTIMKKTLEWARVEWSDHISIAYFFNARGSDELERSCSGLYRCLTYQILSGCENLRALFVNDFSTKEKNGQVEHWTVVELQNFLFKIVNAGHVPMLNVFVDALDEGDEDEIQQMIFFFEKIAKYSTLVGSVFRLCLSSRHYPNISIETGLSVVLEQQSGHTRDIELYIERTLPGRHVPLMKEISDILLQKAANVFLWIVLSISLLRPLYNRGRWKEMKRKLDDIPPGLYDLFAIIVGKDLENLDECVLLLQWVLVARRPLSPRELYQAIQLNDDQYGMENFGELDQQLVINRLLDCSRGLIELTSGPSPRVQFIHETVRQFLISNGTPCIAQSWPTGSHFRSSICNSIVAQGCLTCLSHLSQRTGPMRMSLRELSLAHYSIRYWSAHLRSATGSINPEVLDTIIGALQCSNTRSESGRLHDILRHTQWLNDKRTGKADGSPIYYASIVGVPDLVLRLLSLDMYEINNQEGYFGYPLQAASRLGHAEVVQILLDAGADVNAHGGYYGNALQAALVNGHERVARLLLEKGADVDAGSSFHGNALLAAISEYGRKFGERPLDVQIDADEQSLDNNVTPEHSRKPNHSSTEQHLTSTRTLKAACFHEVGQWFAAWFARPSDVNIEVILSCIEHYNWRTEGIQELLCLAAERGITDGIKWQNLVDAGASLHAIGAYGWTPEMCYGLSNSLQPHTTLTGKCSNIRLPEPTEWQSVDDSVFTLSEDRQEAFVQLLTSEIQLVESAKLYANNFMPADREEYYFEVTILETGPACIIGIGFCHLKCSSSGMPGWYQGSWGYHGDDGKFFNQRGKGNKYGPTYGAGDTVGCGVNFGARTAFFTKNGQHLGIAVSELTGRLLPVCGIGERNVRFRANFGQQPFLYVPEKSSHTT